MGQLDDGIGDTLVLARIVLGEGRLRYHITSIRPRRRRRCHRYRPTGSPDRRPIAVWKQTRAHPFHGTQYKGMADTIVQLIRRSTSGVIAPSHSPKYLEKGW
jgi:hypothetical protein